jgi:hypothetical protein
MARRHGAGESRTMEAGYGRRPVDAGAGATARPVPSSGSREIDPSRRVAEPAAVRVLRPVRETPNVEPRVIAGVAARTA